MLILWLMDTFAQILLPLPLNATFTYRVPPEMLKSIGVGYRVIVPFGKKRFYTGIVTAFVPKAPEGFDIRDIVMTIDNKPVIRHPQTKLWEWLAEYYLCAEGDVYKAAVPAGLRLESETFVELNPDYEPQEGEYMTERDAIVTQLLDHEGAMPIDTIASSTGLKGVQSVVNSLIERGILIVSEKLVERYRPKRISCVAPAFDRIGFAEAFAKVKGAPKQETLLLALVEMSGLQRPESERREVTRADLLDRAG